MTTKTLLIAAFFGSILHAHAQQGLQGEYFNGRNFDEKILTRTDAQISFVWDNVAPAPGLDAHVFSVRWTGKLLAPETGTYMFRAHVDDGIRVMINDQVVINHWELNDSQLFTGEIFLQGGQPYKLRVEYFNALYEGEIQLFWQLPSEAPVFKGLLGYNDHPIDPRYYLAPPPVVSNPAKPAASAPLPSKVAQTGLAKPVAPALKPARISRDTLEKYIPKNILFEKSKSIMLTESEPELDRLAGFLLRNPKYRLRIEGHTDHIGNAAKNQLLSEQRAQTVATYLTQKGIASQRISAKGYGDSRPLVREADGIPNARNRRVEFFIQE
jgi:outer membrane protein OmpA-like peptidoglycan-associated protein